MGVFDNVSYADFASRFVELDKALKPDNPLGIDTDQANNMHKAFGLSYLNLTDELTKLQQVNAPQLVEMANRRLIDFEMSQLNINESSSD